MTCTESIQSCVTKYADFKGCASRSEFWWWGLAIFIASIGLSTISQTLSGLFALATIIPSFAVAARRLHDTNRTGWFQLIGLIPIVGWIVPAVFYVQERKQPNCYSTPSIGHSQAD